MSAATGVGTGGNVVLGARGVAVRLGVRDVLAGVDIALRGGELVLLGGRNGAGKSTLLRALLGAQRVDGGEIELDGRPLALVPAVERARTVAFVPQDADSPFEFTGRELVAMGRHAHRSAFAAWTADDQRAVESALAAVDAAALADLPVPRLSGGEQRRIAMARALATEAPLLLLDEPTANLDLEHALALVELLRRLATEGRGMLVASHDVNLLAPHCDRVVLLHEGRVHVDDAPQRALSREVFATVFGVDAAAPSDYFPRDFRLLS